MLWECYLTSQAVRNEIYYISLCLHSQIRATHWISFLRQLSLSLWCSSFFLFWFALTKYPPQRESHVPYTLSIGGTRANECSITCDPIISFPEESKKDAKMLWMYDWKCHLQDCTFMTVLLTKGIQLHWRNKRDLLYCI